MHYSKTTGRIEKDRSTLGLVFAKQPPRKQVITRLISNNYFRIPAGAENHRVTACWTSNDDIHLVRIAPHMRYRGRSMEIKAIYPDGRSETLIHVPKYDFSWQVIYPLKKPLAIPKRTRFVVTGQFDNSARNKYKPGPAQVVRWGQPTYDEMMIGLIEYTIDNGDEQRAKNDK